MSITGYAGYVEAEAGAGPIASTLYGVCNTAAETAAKVVSLPAFTNLLDGVSIRVRFKYSNTAENPTLNVENTGAKPIFRYGTTRPGTTPETSWGAGAVVSLTYDLETDAWYLDNWMNTNTTYGNATSGTAGLMSGTDKTNLDALQAAKSGYDGLVTNKTKIFTNVSVAANLWTSSSTYTNYGFQADISGLTGVDATWFPIVAFNPNHIDSYSLAPAALSQAGGKLRIYAAVKPTSAITIPSIAFIK